MIEEAIKARLSNALSSRREDVFALGDLLAEAKTALGPKAFRAMLAELGMGYHAAMAHIKIARSPSLKLSSAQLLPPNWATLVLLADLPSEVVSKEISPSTTRAQANAIRIRTLGPSQVKARSKSWNPEPLTKGLRDGYAALRGFMDDLASEYVGETGQLKLTPDQIKAEVMAKLKAAELDLAVNRSGDVGKLEINGDTLTIRVGFYHPEMVDACVTITLAWGVGDA